jgi:hypothetical protein
VNTRNACGGFARGWIAGTVCGAMLAWLPSAASAAPEGPLLTVKSHTPLVEQPLVKVAGGAKLPAALGDARTFVWGKPPAMPDKADGAIQVTAARDGVVLLAACWRSDSKEIELEDSEWSDIDDLTGDGWFELTEIKLPNPLSHEPQSHTLLLRTVRAGERLKLRTRVFNPPYLIVPADRPGADFEAFEPWPGMLEWTARSLLRRKVNYLLQSKRFDDLEACTAGYLKHKAKFGSGAYRLTAVYAACSRPAKDRDDENAWASHVALVDAWAQARPQSATARLALARAYIHYAWHARGSGDADTITPEGWQQFHKRLKQASDQLAQAERLSDRDPDLYAAKIAIGKGLGMPHSQAEAIVRKCVAIEPWCPETMQEMAVYLLPRWGGQPGELERFAKQAVEMTHETCGRAMYFYVVYEIVHYESDVFKTHHFSWTLVKQSYDDLDKRFPASELNRHRCCLLACAAGDRERARELFAELTPRFPTAVWSDSANFKRWKRWAQVDYLTGDQRRVLEFRHRVYGVAWLDGGRKLLATTSSPRCEFWDANLGAPLTSDRLPAACHALAAAPDGRHAALGDTAGNLLSWSLETHQLSLIRPPGAKIGGVVFSADGGTIIVGGDDSSVGWLEISENQVNSSTIEYDKGAVTSLALSRDGRLLATGSADGNVSLWKALVHQRQASWQAHEGQAREVALSPDGKLLASGSLREVKLWNTETHELAASLPGVTENVRDLGFSPDGSLLAAAIGHTGKYVPCHVLLWNVRSGKLAGELKGHKACVTSVAFSPDGKSLATGSYDMTVRIWDVSRDER